MPLTATGVRRRFLVLRALRWLPTGLVIPVLVLVLLDRGLSLGQIGVAAAAQGAVTLLLEIPTGGLADTYGRRRVLIGADLFELASMGLLLVADDLGTVTLVFVLFGVFRALESGPLDAWYVDAAQAVDADADIEAGLAAGGAVAGGAIAAGTLLSGAANAIHQAILHRGVTEPGMRATVVSANSMASQVGGMVGAVTLGWLAGAASLSTAIVVGAAVLAIAAPLYGWGGREGQSGDTGHADDAAVVPT